MSQCRGFIREMADAVRQRWGVGKVVLLVDSLERLRGVGDEAVKRMFDHVLDVFDNHRDRLSPARVHVVYAVPPYLPYLSNVGQYVSMTLLASVRVCQPPKVARRQPRPDGLAVMRRVLDKRFDRWREVISPAAVDALDLPMRKDWLALVRFFEIRALLNYRNGTDWLDINPLLWPLIDRHQANVHDVADSGPAAAA